MFIGAVAERISSLSLRQTERAFIFLDDIRNEAAAAALASQQQLKMKMQTEKNERISTTLTLNKC